MKDSKKDGKPTRMVLFEHERGGYPLLVDQERLQDEWATYTGVIDDNEKKAQIEEVYRRILALLSKFSKEVKEKLPSDVYFCVGEISTEDMLDTKVAAPEQDTYWKLSGSLTLKNVRKLTR